MNKFKRKNPNPNLYFALPNVNKSFKILDVCGSKSSNRNLCSWRLRFSIFRTSLKIMLFSSIVFKHCQGLIGNRVFEQCGGSKY